MKEACENHDKPRRSQVISAYLGNIDLLLRITEAFRPICITDSNDASLSEKLDNLIARMHPNEYGPAPKRPTGKAKDSPPDIGHLLQYHDEEGIAYLVGYEILPRVELVSSDFITSE